MSTTHLPPALESHDPELRRYGIRRGEGHRKNGLVSYSRNSIIIGQRNVDKCQIVPQVSPIAIYAFASQSLGGSGR